MGYSILILSSFLYPFLEREGEREMGKWDKGSEEIFLFHHASLIAVHVVIAKVS